MSQAGLISVAGGGGSIQFNENVGTALPAAGILNIVGGAGITTSGSGNTVTITAVSSGFTWNTITSANNVQQIAKENGYISTGGVLCTLLLPAAPTVGDTFIVTGFSALWQIQQNALQQIYLGSTVTTAGVIGSLTSTNALDHVQIAYVAANSWKVIDVIGNITVA
jgi:hypothetical protein